MKSTAIDVALNEYKKGIDDESNNFTDSQKVELETILNGAKKVANNPAKVRQLSKKLTKLDKKFVAFGGDLDKVADGVDDVQKELNKHVPINKVIGVIKKANTLPSALKKAINKGDD